tara:strand:- start:2625 stop:2945 length:321 start_codon:yes stop_codon:yes gene_type:complete
VYENIIFESFFMKVQLAIIGAVLIVGAILFFPETTSQVSEGTSVFDAIVTDAINIKEYNSHTSQVGDTIYDVSIEMSETMVDVADKVEDTIDSVEISPNQILNLED